MRADAGIAQGSGHVMRCLTLGQELLSRGHEVVLATCPSSIGWLNHAIRSSGMRVEQVVADSLDGNLLVGLRPDWVVVDSYQIASAQISGLTAEVNVLAIIDGDSRGIDATRYLDQNLGSESRPWPSAVRKKLLAGSQFALVRSEILRHRRPKPWIVTGTPKVLAFMGGTDPTGSIVTVASQLALVGGVQITIVAPPDVHAVVKTTLAGVEGVKILRPTSELPELLAGADIVVSAAGTSSWDVCALRLPSVLIAIVDNQSDSLESAVAEGVALGINVFREGETAFTHLARDIERLVSQESLREALSTRCDENFDGRGAARVVHEMEGGAQ